MNISGVLSIFSTLLALPMCLQSKVGGTVRCPFFRLSVHLSVPAWAHRSKPTAAGLLLWALLAGDIARLLQQRRANAGSATSSAYVGS